MHAVAIMPGIGEKTVSSVEEDDSIAEGEEVLSRSSTASASREIVNKADSIRLERNCSAARSYEYYGPTRKMRGDESGGTGSVRSYGGRRWIGVEILVFRSSHGVVWSISGPLFGQQYHR